MCGISKKLQKIAKYSCLDRQVRHQYLNNANFCNFFDNIPQILRVKASAIYNIHKYMFKYMMVDIYRITSTS